MFLDWELWLKPVQMISLNNQYNLRRNEISMFQSMFPLVIFGVFSRGVLGVDRNLFRDCSTAAFCHRFTKYIRGQTAKLMAHRNFQQISDSEFLFDLKREAEQDWSLTATLTAYENGAVRVQIDDKNPVRPRFRIPEGDVVGSAVNLAKHVESTTSAENQSSFSFKPSLDSSYPPLPNVTVTVSHDPFEISIFSGNRLIQKINSRGFFNFERHRNQHGDQCSSDLETSLPIDAACGPDSETQDAWEEDFNGFHDTKPFGPSAVGLDVAFEEASDLYGIPEHTTSFSLPTDRNFRLFNLDVFEYELDDSAALYGGIPFVISRLIGSPNSSGFLWLNPSDTFVRFERSHDSPSLDSWWVSESGIIDFVVFPGPTHGAVLRQYHGLTGFAPIPPIFSIGKHQSRWNYFTEEEVKEVTDGYKEHGIPLDAIWLDIEHTNEKRYLTWDAQKFPDPIRMQNYLEEQGRKLIAIMDPHVAMRGDFPTFQKMSAAGIIHDAKGNVFKGDCWPGRSVYPDYTNPAVRKVWSDSLAFDKYSGSTASLHAWNDMNEPSVFNSPEITVPKDALHSNGFEHRDVHNLYGMYFHRATFEGMVNRTNGKDRPFILTRSFFAGSQKYGPTWTGDNSAEWSHLKVSVSMLLSLNIAGFSFAGADVGGFFNNPDKELYIRWQQFAAAAYPFYRSHSEIKTKRREPWRFDEETIGIVRKAVESRYRLIYYWYTLFAENSKAGTPILRPMWWSCETCPDVDEQLMVGESILVKAITKPGISFAFFYLPAGVWYYNDEEIGTQRMVSKGENTGFHLSLEKIPVLFKGGSILPVNHIKRDSTASMLKDPITLEIYPDSEGYAKGSLYVDDGKTIGSLSSWVEFEYSENILRRKVVQADFEGPMIVAVVIAGEAMHAKLFREENEESLLLKSASGSTTVTGFETSSTSSDEWYIDLPLMTPGIAEVIRFEL